MIEADEAFIVPQASDDGFIDTMLKICQENNIKLIFSLHDWETPFIAKNLDLFRENGTIAVVSKPEVIHVCLDKYATFLFAQKHGISSCHTYVTTADVKEALGERIVRYPLILKPRRGQGSLGLEIVKTSGELRCAFQLLRRRISRMNGNGLLQDDAGQTIVIQEYIDGTEYGMDVVNDLSGNFVTCFVKRKLGMRAGETDAAETVRDKKLEALGRKIGTSLGHVGMLDVDIIVQDDVPYLLEMNPRFGGHYPFSHMAGADIPSAIIAWAKGEAPDSNWLKIKPGVRCFKDIAIVKE